MLTKFSYYLVEAKLQQNVLDFNFNSSFKGECDDKYNLNYLKPSNGRVFYHA